MSSSKRNAFIKKNRNCDDLSDTYSDVSQNDYYETKKVQKAIPCPRLIKRVIDFSGCDENGTCIRVPKNAIFAQLTVVGGGSSGVLATGTDPLAGLATGGGGVSGAILTIAVKPCQEIFLTLGSGGAGISGTVGGIEDLSPPSAVTNAGGDSILTTLCATIRIPGGVATTTTTDPEVTTPVLSSPLTSSIQPASASSSGGIGVDPCCGTIFTSAGITVNASGIIIAIGGAPSPFARGGFGTSLFDSCRATRGAGGAVFIEGGAGTVTATSAQIATAGGNGFAQLCYYEWTCEPCPKACEFNAPQTIPCIGPCDRPNPCPINPVLDRCSLPTVCPSACSTNRCRPNCNGCSACVRPKQKFGTDQCSRCNVTFVQQGNGRSGCACNGAATSNGGFFNSAFAGGGVIGGGTGGGFPGSGFLGGLSGFAGGLPGNLSNVGGTGFGI